MKMVNSPCPGKTSIARPAKKNTNPNTFFKNIQTSLNSRVPIMPPVSL